MTATFQATGDLAAPTPLQRIWNRQLTRYPNNLTRYTSLAIVVATTVVLYYQQYLAGGVGTQVLRDTGMSFMFFVNISVVGNLAGAVASLLAGMADRYGRANIVTVGLGVASLLTLFAVPAVHTEFPLAVILCLIGFIEGIVLVATPALVRDFSPQLGRASAMGFWTLGPVLGSLVVSALTTSTFKGHRASSAFGWFFEYRVAGIVSLAVFAVAVIGLRELSPGLRDQLMVSEKDRVLIEARAKGLDIEATLKRPFRQMLHLDIVGSAFAISVFLIIYYIAVGFFPIFFQTIFGYSASKANGLGNYFWLFDAVALVTVGYLSDKLGVRKPFMVLGGVAAVVFTAIFAAHADDKSASHTFFVLVLIAMSVSLAVAYAPWMASFTETVERHNPALTATGLAVWGMIIRVVIAVAVVIAPHLVNTVSTIIEKGPTVQAEATRYAPELATAAKIAPATQAALAANPGDQAAQVAALSQISGVPQADIVTIATHQTALVAAQAIDSQTAVTLATNPADAAAGAKAVGEIVAKTGVTPAVAIADLKSLATIPPAQLALIPTEAPKVAAATAQLTALGKVPPSVTSYLTKNGASVQSAVARSPKQWRDYFWVGVGGEVVFIPLVLLMAGYWDPRRAKAAEREHEAMVAAEMAKLQTT